MDAQETEALIRRAQQGEVRAFELLVAAHLPLVRRFARAFARNDDEAGDLAQEALVKVYRSIRSYGFQSAFSTWLYAIVRNVFLDGARSRVGKERAAEQPLERRHMEGRPTTDGDVIGDADAMRADLRLEREQERKRVWDALVAVPPEFRTTLVLYDIEGLSYDEVAAIERVPLGTVKSRLSRGREHLRRALSTADSSAKAADSEAGNPSPGPLVTPPKRTETA
jgi:RNA polymerase sigma-70 factor (ECF subfamily)